MEQTISPEEPTLALKATNERLLKIRAELRAES